MQFRSVPPGTGGTYQPIGLLVCGLLAIGWYRENRPSMVDFGRRRSIERKEERRRRGKEEKKKEERSTSFPHAVLTRALSSPAGRSPVVAALACGRFFSRARRWNVSPLGEKDRGDTGGIYRSDRIPVCGPPATGGYRASPGNEATPRLPARERGNEASFSRKATPRLSLLVFQIKRCGEMARKLRLFREQMAKAGIAHSEMAMTQTRIDFDDMEVNFDIPYCMCCHMLAGISNVLVSIAIRLIQFQLNMKLFFIQVSGKITELKTTIDLGMLHRDNILKNISYQFEQWNNLVSIIFKSGSLSQIQDALQRATYDSNSQVGSIFQVLHTKESPPTYFQTNKFTSAFQEIVDAYG
ncbi:hypothetical protein BHE74_00034601 [Ensete ventricosum]|nr:hypothetical protein BHE74_00034601 [Ensete ventricosum]